MVKSNPEILKEASELMLKDFTYREIQDLLINKFGKGLSNNTLKRIKREQNILQVKDIEIKKLRQELELFKSLYFELLESTQNNLSKNHIKGKE